MASGVKSWSTTAATNASADSTINWAEGQAPSTVNDSARAMMAAIAAWFALTDQGTVSNGTVGGSAAAITLTCSPTVDARVAGQRYAFKLGSAITGATTLAVDGLSSGAVQWNQAAIVANDFAANDYVVVIDDGTNYQLVTPPKISSYAQITNITADGTGATGDKVVTYDVSASAPKSMTLAVLQTLFAATQAQMETGTSTAVNVTPGIQKYHPNHPKGFVKWAGAAQTIGVSNNVASIDDNATGDLTINFTTAFSTANYHADGLSQRNATNSDCHNTIKQGTAPTASAFRMMTVAGDATAIDSTYATASFIGDWS